MSNRDDIDMLAAEYVLGTLDREERSDVEARRPTDVALDTAIAAWEERLAPLNARAGEAAPSAAVAEKIRQRLAVSPALNREFESGSPDAEIVILRRHRDWWRRAAIAATAAAAVFAGLFVFNQRVEMTGNQQFVAVFNQGDTQPAFVLSINLATRELTIRPITAQGLSDKSYELWIVSDQIKLRSLGLLDAAGRSTRKQLTTFDASQLRGATFGISVEPKGGSPSGKPTGPAIHGKLIPAES